MTGNIKSLTHLNVFKALKKFIIFLIHDLVLFLGKRVSISYSPASDLRSFFVGQHFLTVVASWIIIHPTTCLVEACSKGRRARDLPSHMLFQVRHAEIEKSSSIFGEIFICRLWKSPCTQLLLIKFVINIVTFHRPSYRPNISLFNFIWLMRCLRWALRVLIWRAHTSSFEMTIWWLFKSRITCTWSRNISATR